MSNNLLVFTTILVLLFPSGAVAQDYELDWNDIHTTVKEADDYTLDWLDTESSVSLYVEPKPIEKPAESNLAAFPTPRELRTKQPNSALFAPKAHLNLVVSQWYDYDQYRIVDRVEVTIYPEEGGIRYRTFENLGALREYDVYLKNLTPGSRYKAFIVWNDGSNRTMEGTLRGQGWRAVYVDEPDPLSYKVWPTSRW